MKKAAKPSGTPKEATKQSILTEELAALQLSRDKIKEANSRYVDQHPELRTLLDEFTSAAIAQKPSDLIKFGTKWFASLRDGAMGFSPLILTGPSGCGKSTLANKLIEKYPRVFAKPIETTTRVAKEVEVNGEDFYFVEEIEFQAIKERNEFIEWKPVYQNFYGTTIAAVELVIDSGRICILDLEFERIQKYKDSPLDNKIMFIAPPSMDVLEDRLNGSRRYNAGAIEEKMEDAIEQMEFGCTEGNFDGVLYNDELEPSFHELIYELIQWYVSADIDPPKPLVKDEEEVEVQSEGKSTKKSTKK